MNNNSEKKMKTLSTIWGIILSVLVLGEIIESFGRSVAKDSNLHKKEISNAQAKISLLKYLKIIGLS